jgi:transcription elongation factor SPT5
VVERLKQRNAAERKQERKYKQMASSGVISSSSSSLAVVSRVQPTYKDKVYVIKVNGVNKEKAAVMTLMNKLIHLNKVGNPSAVSSVFCNTTRGVIYIESHSEIAAKELVTGMRNLKAYSIKMVPITDLTRVLTIKGVAQRAASLTPGSWVRVKRLNGYKGDICRVAALTAGGANAIVQIEPRLDYAAIEEEYSCDVNDRADVRKELKAKV